MTNPQLFGREKELAWLDGCWRDGVHVATLVAFGGVGKSALVNRWLADMRDEGWPGAERVFGWSFYSQGTERLSSSDEFFAAALREFGDTGPVPTSPWDKGERLARLVGERRGILVLDGLEPLQWGPGVQAGRLKDQAMEALLKELGAQNKGLCVVSSRLPLADLDGLRGDKVRPHDLEHLVPEAGAEVLRAQGAKGLAGELRAASEEYGGHSLSLTLLGNYLRRAHKGDVQARRHIPLGEKPAQRMFAIYERWFQDKPELAILRLLGFFDRPAPEEEIATLLAQPVITGLTDALDGLGKAGWNEAVTALRDVGLLAREAEGDDRLDAHPLVREHFGEQVKKAHPEAWREGHRRLYEFLRAKAKLLPETIEEMAPLYAAVVHGCLAGKNQEAFDEVFRERINRGGDSFHWSHFGAFGGELAILSAFFAPPWERLAPGLDERGEARVLNSTARALRALGRLSEATDLQRRAVKAMADARTLANWNASLSEILQARGELREAEAPARESVALADACRHDFQRLRCRTTLAVVLYALGRGGEAEEAVREARQMHAQRLEKARAPEHPLLYSYTGFLLDDIPLDQGGGAEARRRPEQTLAQVEEKGFLVDIALDHLSLGRADLRAGDALERGASHLDRAVEGLRRSGYQELLPHGLLARAALRISTADLPAARHDLDEALPLATRIGARLHEADAHLGLTRLALAAPAPDLPAARDHLAAARSIITATSYHRRDPDLAALAAEIAARSAGPA